MTPTGRRPLVYDLTYVVARLHASVPTGIERVDAAYARHHFGGDPGEAIGLHYGLLRPHVLTPTTARRIVAEAGQAWTPDDEKGDDAFAAVLRWLEQPARPVAPVRPTRATPPLLDRLSHQIGKTWHRLTNDGPAVPRDALYLNVAQYAFEYPLVFRWLEARPDVRPVFFIHDLLPLENPEFFRAGYGALFERRVATMARFAHAAIVSNGTVAERVADEMARRGRASMPILAEPLPPPTQARDLQDRDGADNSAERLAAAAPYFVILATIEPRKNHLLLLNLWRDLAKGPGPVPRLVVVGARGWDNEQVIDLLERSRSIAPHVLEVSGLGTAGLDQLIRGAGALLMPSFEEGYGLPIAEALAAGTPVIGSDIPVFREVSQGRALLLDPTDGPGWREAIRTMAAPASLLRGEWAEAARHYRAPDWPGYFATVDRFLATL